MISTEPKDHDDEAVPTVISMNMIMDADSKVGIYSSCPFLGYFVD